MRVEIPTDQTPKYVPELMLSPEYQGRSNYESGVASHRDEIEEKLAKLQKDPNASQQELHQAEEDLKTVDYLFEISILEWMFSVQQKVEGANLTNKGDL